MLSTTLLIILLLLFKSANALVLSSTKRHSNSLRASSSSMMEGPKFGRLIDAIMSSNISTVEMKEILTESHDMTVAFLNERIARRDEKIDCLGRELLQAQNLLGSRGIFEFYLRASYGEIKGKKYGAKDACDAIIRGIKDDTIGNNRKTKAIIEAAQTCRINIDELYSLYGILSEDIHGIPWSGPPLKIYSKKLEPKYVCFIRELAKDLGIIYVDEDKTM